MSIIYPDPISTLSISLNNLGHNKQCNTLGEQYLGEWLGVFFPNKVFSNPPTKKQPTTLLLKYQTKIQNIFQGRDKFAHTQMKRQICFKKMWGKVSGSTVHAWNARCNLGPLAAMFIGPSPERWDWANELTRTLAFYPSARPAKPWAFSVNTIQTVQ